jgi:outer membrane protein OmpA-like peptidoglycan-associated protein
MTGMKLLTLLLLGLSVTLAGCSSSRVILLDSGEAGNAIVVKTEQGELVLDQPNTYTELSSSRAKPTTAKPIEQQEIQQRYGALLQAAPKPPVHILLYFEPSSTTLTTSSKKLLPTIEQAIQERIPCDVNIIGHTDRTGSQKYNTTLSLQRARVIYEWLQGRKLGIEHVVVESYGEEDPLVPTPDGVSEPRNRRVEILIR